MKTLLDEKDVLFGTMVIAINDGKARGKEDYYKAGRIAKLTHWFTDDTFGALEISTNIIYKKDFMIYNPLTTYEIY